MKRIGSLSDKGILHAKAGKRKFTLDRYEPSPDLAPFVEHYWKVGWDLRGHPPPSRIPIFPVKKFFVHFARDGELFGFRESLFG